MISKISKKVCILVRLLLISVLAITVLWLENSSTVYLKGKNQDTLQEAIRIIGENPTDIMLYGDDIVFKDKEEVPYRKIEEINNKSLKQTSNYKNSFLVINDMSNKINLDKNTIKLINNYVDKEGYAVMYFGDKYISAWDNNGYIANVEGGKSVVIQNEWGNVVRIVGNWGKEEEEMSKEYPYLQSQALIYQIESFIRANK